MFRSSVVSTSLDSVVHPVWTRRGIFPQYRQETPQFLCVRLRRLSMTQRTTLI